MLFTYCPQCGSMDISRGGETPSCKKCHYSGKMSQDSMDRINEVRQRAAKGNPTASSSDPALPASGEDSPSVKELAARLKSLKGKSTGDAEFL